MAAVTIEDCLKIIPNRFELALVASARAKDLSNGAPILYNATKKEKNTVVALREISKDLVNIDQTFVQIKNNLKNKNSFKNLDDSSVYEVKRSDTELSELNEDLAVGEMDEAFEDDFDDAELEEDDDEEYYNNLTSEIEEEIDEK